MFERIKSMFAPRARTVFKAVKARFDSAQTTKDNARHWSAADALSADGEASPEVRRTLRMRSRYEIANNSYARGLVQMLANDTIGTGPRLQMLTDDEAFNDEAEAAFAKWSEAVMLPQKLRTMRMARCQDGEAFAVLDTNPGIRHPVKLGLTLIEADRVSGEPRWMEADGERTLLDHRSRDCQEKIFDTLKNATENGRLRVSGDASQEGRVFIAFLAVTLGKMVENALRKADLLGVMTVNKALDLARKFKVVQFADAAKVNLEVPLKTRELFEAIAPGLLLEHGVEPGEVGRKVRRPPKNVVTTKR
jgi:hypothetical protein